MKKKSFVVILILLIIVILGLVCYIAYDKGVFDALLKKESSTKEEKQNTEEKVIEEKEETLDVNSIEVVNLIKYFDIFNDRISTSSDNMFARMYTSDKTTVDDLSDSEKGYIAISNVVEHSSSLQEISATDVENMVKKIFGNVNYTHGDIPGYGCAYGKISYIASNNTYKTSGLDGCGGTCNPNVQYKIVKAVKTGDILNITVAIIYQTCEDKTGNFYLEYYSDLNYTNKLYEDHNNSFNIDNYLDKLDKYTYTFKQDSNNNYVFTQIEKQ